MTYHNHSDEILLQNILTCPYFAVGFWRGKCPAEGTNSKSTVSTTRVANKPRTLQICYVWILTENSVWYTRVWEWLFCKLDKMTKKCCFQLVVWHTSGALRGNKNVNTESGICLFFPFFFFTALFYSLANVCNINYNFSLPQLASHVISVNFAFQLHCAVLSLNVSVCQCTDATAAIVKTLSWLHSSSQGLQKKTSPNKTLLHPCCLARLLGHILYFAS